jgi:hypothetical protein
MSLAFWPECRALHDPDLEPAVELSSTTQLSAVAMTHRNRSHLSDLDEGNLRGEFLTCSRPRSCCQLISVLESACMKQRAKVRRPGNV